MSRKSSTYHPVHTHSYYSVLDGVGSIDEYADVAAREGMGYLAVTDHHMAAAWPMLVEVCTARQLRPVFGVEVYVNDWHHLVPQFDTLSDDQKQAVRRNCHVLLFAENNKGFENLIHLVSDGWEHGFYYRPRVSFKQIAEHSEGLCATSGCLSSPVNRQLLQDKPEDARQLLREWAQVFGGGQRYWVEWMMIGIQQQDANNVWLRRLAEEEGLEPIVTNDIHYQQPSDAVVQSVQLAVRSGTVSQIIGTRLAFGEQPEFIASDLGVPMHEVRRIAQQADTDEEADDKVFQIQTRSLWFATEGEMDERWDTAYKDTIDLEFYERSKRQSLALCQRCGYVEPDRSPKLPTYPDADSLLRDLTYAGLRRRGLDKNPTYTARAEMELEMLMRKGYNSYLLIDLEMIQAARSMGCPIGPGRGSVCGCLVAWAIGITEVDPIRHGTLFERFLSYSRGGRQLCCSLH